MVDRLRALLEEGIAAGTFRPIAVSDAIRIVLGAVSLYSVSGNLADRILGESSHSESAVAERRQEVIEFIRRGLLA